MSVSYLELLGAVKSAFEEVGATFNVISPVPQARNSIKAKAGPNSKVVANLVRLDISQRGAGAEHGNAQTRGVLVFKLSPSKADTEVGIDSLAEMFDLGHRAMVHLDGKNGVRLANIDSSASLTGIQFTAVLTFGQGLTSDVPGDALAGRG